MVKLFKVMRKDEELQSQLDVSVTTSGLLVAQPRFEPEPSKFSSFGRLMSSSKLEMSSGSKVDARPRFESRSRSEMTFSSEKVLEAKRKVVRPEFGGNGLKPETRLKSKWGLKISDDEKSASNFRSLKKPEAVASVESEIFDEEDESEPTTGCSIENLKLKGWVTAPLCETMILDEYEGYKAVV